MTLFEENCLLIALYCGIKPEEAGWKLAYGCLDGIDYVAMKKRDSHDLDVWIDSTKIVFERWYSNEKAIYGEPVVYPNKKVNDAEIKALYE